MPKDRRTYITIAVDMPDHPKLATLSDAQKWRVVDALCYARKYTTDGVFDLSVWRKRYPKRDRDAILATGFAVEFKGGVVMSGPAENRQDSDRIREKFRSATGEDLPQNCVLFLDYPEHQQTRREVERLQEIRSSAGRKGGQKSGQTRQQKRSEREASASANAKQTPKQNEPELEIEKDSYYVTIPPTPQGGDASASRPVVDEDGFDYPGDLLGSTPDAEPAPPAKAAKAEPFREDVEHLCELLRDLIVQNGNRAPAKVPTSWRTAARLLLDRDGVTVEQARAVIHWCQGDDFWHANILSMPTLRKQYPKLEAKARAAYRGPSRPNPTIPARTTQQAQRDALDDILNGFDDASPALATVHPIIQGELTA